jgi:hypothetical protein
VFSVRGEKVTLLGGVVAGGDGRTKFGKEKFLIGLDIVFISVSEIDSCIRLLTDY